MTTPEDFINSLYNIDGLNCYYIVQTSYNENDNLGVKSIDRFCLSYKNNENIPEKILDRLYLLKDLEFLYLDSVRKFPFSILKIKKLKTLHIGVIDHTIIPYDSINGRFEVVIKNMIM